MRAWESSEPAVVSATIRIRRAFVGMATAALLAGTACGAGWTGSVGAILGKRAEDGRVFVREAPAGMGAARAGLVAGDEVTTIDGRAVDRMTPTEIHEALAGKVGTTVRLTVRRGGVSRDVDVERGPLSGT